MNQICVIAPYLENGVWVFDDESVGLKKEPFVAGIPEIINQATEDLDSPEDGFLLFFSPQSFPDCSVKLEFLREESGGAWYTPEDTDLEGWLCPAMWNYFDTLPEEIYVRVSNKPRQYKEVRHGS